MLTLRGPVLAPVVRTLYFLERDADGLSSEDSGDKVDGPSDAFVRHGGKGRVASSS